MESKLYIISMHRESGNVKYTFRNFACVVRKTAIQKIFHIAADEDHLLNRSLCVPVRDRVKTRTSFSIR